VTTAELGKGLIVRLLNSLVRSVPSVTGSGLVLLDDDGRRRQIGGVGAAEHWDAAQLDCRCGPLTEAVLSDEVRIVDPFQVDSYPSLAGSAPVAVPAALVVLPGPWAGEGRLATTLYLDTSPDGHALTTVGAYEPLLAHALGLLEYCNDAETRADQMLQMMQHRRVIEQAKGMVMTRRSVGAGEAFARLAEVSQHHNIRLRELAVALVEGVGGAPAEQPAEPTDRVQATPGAVDVAKRLWDDLSS
jgi:hypothetical protein